MFHPLYNADGSFSKFRFTCILVAASCMFATGIIGVLENDSSVVSAKVENSDLGGDLDEQSSSLKKVNEQAIAALKDGADFMKTCGTVNHGYDNCNWKPDSNLRKFYQTGIETGDDGFIIVMTSKDRQRSDLYSKLEADSNGRLLAFDNNGNRMNTSKFMSLQESKLSLNRRTDNLNGEPSLSNFNPIADESALAQKIGEFAKM